MSKRAFTPEERIDIQKVVALWIMLLSGKHNSEQADDLAMVARKTLSVLEEFRKVSEQTPVEIVIERLLIERLELSMAFDRDEVARKNKLRAAAAGLPKD